MRIEVNQLESSMQCPLSGSPTHLLLEVTFMAVGEPDYNDPGAQQANRTIPEIYSILVIG